MTEDLIVCFRILMKHNSEQVEARSKYIKSKHNNGEREEREANPSRLSCVKRSGIRSPKEVVLTPTTRGKKVATMFDKNKCWEIFQEAKTEDDTRLYLKKTIEKKIEYKFNISKR